MITVPFMSSARDIDFVTLRLFLAALEEGSLARAAARENIVPSAVSKRMSELEEIVGVPLLERNGKGVQPTVAGVALAMHARGLIQGLARMREEMTAFATGVKGQIRLAVSVAALSGELPVFIHSFRRAHPQIDLSLLEMTTQEAFRAVREGVVDIAIGSDFGHEGLKVFPWGHCALAAVVPGNHYLANLDRLNYEQLLPFDQVELNRENGISGVLDQTARATGVVRRISARVSAHETVCLLVSKGLGVAVVPAYMQARHTHLDLRFIPLNGPWASTPISIAVKEDESLSPAALTLMKHIGVKGAELT